MRKNKLIFMLLSIVFVFAVATSGCKKKSDHPEGDKTAGEHPKGEHDHSDGDHPTGDSEHPTGK